MTEAQLDPQSHYKNMYIFTSETGTLPTLVVLCIVALPKRDLFTDIWQSRRHVCVYMLLYILSMTSGTFIVPLRLT